MQVRVLIRKLTESDMISVVPTDCNVDSGIDYDEEFEDLSDTDPEDEWEI